MCEPRGQQGFPNSEEIHNKSGWVSRNPAEIRKAETLVFPVGANIKLRKISNIFNQNVLP